jgi:hypothetical protein
MKRSKRKLAFVSEQEHKPAQLFWHGTGTAVEILRRQKTSKTTLSGRHSQSTFAKFVHRCQAR